mgnify:CR=1
MLKKSKSGIIIALLPHIGIIQMGYFTSSLILLTTIVINIISLSACNY